MTVWMLSKFYREPVNSWKWPVADSYSNGHHCPRHPLTEDGWALVKCNVSGQHLEAAEQDPRVHVYRTLWDPITPETVTAYESYGAKTGMMLGQLIQILAREDHGYAG